MYLSRTPDFVKNAFPDFVWSIPSNSKEIFLTFDDGPITGVTEFVLETLQKYKAKATFFCVGSNIEKNPELFERIQREGHAIGSHSQDHLSGWASDNQEYIENVHTAATLSKSKLFRPPYGRIKLSQAKQLRKDYEIIMWDVLSGDFDPNLSIEKCKNNVIKNTSSGSIIVFHDNEKSFETLQKVLPNTLEYFTNKNYSFKSITLDRLHVS